MNSGRALESGQDRRRDATWRWQPSLPQASQSVTRLRAADYLRDHHNRTRSHPGGGRVAGGVAQTRSALRYGASNRQAPRAYVPTGRALPTCSQLGTRRDAGRSRWRRRVALIFVVGSSSPKEARPDLSMALTYWPVSAEGRAEGCLFSTVHSYTNTRARNVDGPTDEGSARSLATRTSSHHRPARRVRLGSSGRISRSRKSLPRAEQYAELNLVAERW